MNAACGGDGSGKPDRDLSGIFRTSKTAAIWRLFSYEIRYLALSATIPCRLADGREISEVSRVRAPGFRERKEESGAMTS